MQDAGDFRADFCADAELFFEFALQGFGRGLSGLDFASGEFPFERESLVLGALAAEDFVSANDQRCHDLLGHSEVLVFSTGERVIMRRVPGSVRRGWRSARPACGRLR